MITLRLDLGSLSVNLHYLIQPVVIASDLDSYPPNEMDIFAPQNDLQEDPNEVNSLYGKPEFEDITIDLKKKLKDLRAKYKDNNRRTIDPKNLYRRFRTKLWVVKSHLKIRRCKVFCWQSKCID